MKRSHLLLTVLTAIFATACASQSATTETSNPPAHAAKSSPDKAAPIKDTAKKEAPVEGVIVGKPAAGSKFAKLKIGMTSAQVTKQIGQPTKQWTHPTGKAAIPFYFGADRWALQYSYKSEGVLTFNAGGDQVLTRVEVNKAE